MIVSLPAFAGTKKVSARLIGSLLLGLFDDSGALQHVGVCASFTEKKRRELVRIPRAIPRARACRSPLERLGRACTSER